MAITYLSESHSLQQLTRMGGRTSPWGRFAWVGRFTVLALASAAVACSAGSGSERAEAAAGGGQAGAGFSEPGGAPHGGGNIHSGGARANSDGGGGGSGVGAGGSLPGCGDMQRDPANCGACGNVCGEGTVCSLGTCSPAYYISPTGADANDGRSPDRAKKTFGAYFNTQKPLQAGSTLVLLDSDDYGEQTTGLPNLDCSDSGNAANGTAEAPIVIRAEHERTARITGDGIGNTFTLKHCQFYVIEGLDLRNVDNAAPGAYGGILDLTGTRHVTVRRNLLTHPNYICPGLANASPGNVGCNNFSLQAIDSDDLIVEDNEVSEFRRHGMIVGHRGVYRRNVLIQRLPSEESSCTDTGIHCTLASDCPGGMCMPRSEGGYSATDCLAAYYTGSQAIMENNICVGTEGSMRAFGLPITECQGGTNAGAFCTNASECPDGGTCSAVPSHDEKFLGNISFRGGDINGDGTNESWAGRGFFAGSKDGLTPSVDVVMRDNVVVAPSAYAVWHRLTVRAVVDHVTVLGFGASPSPGSWGIYADASSGTPCETTPCTMAVSNALVLGGTGDGIGAGSANTTVTHSNVYAISGTKYSVPGETGTIGDTSGAITYSKSVAVPSMGIGANQCALWVPDAATDLKGAGSEGSDIGANILYAYENGKLTNKPLWRNSDGQFLGCGAIVAGLNDPVCTEGTSTLADGTCHTDADCADTGSGSHCRHVCVNLQYRLNINQNGCEFPKGYVGW